MARKIRLKVQHGTDEVNYGTHRYPVDLENDTVEVPEEAARPLLEKAGVVEVEDEQADDGAPPLPEGHCWMKHTSDPNASCSFGAASYAPGPDGFLSVPVSLAGELIAHGFVVVERPLSADALVAEPAPISDPLPEAAREPATAPEAPDATVAATDAAPAVSVEPEAVAPANEAAV